MACGSVAVAAWWLVCVLYLSGGSPCWAGLGILDDACVDVLASPDQFQVMGNAVHWETSVEFGSSHYYIEQAADAVAGPWQLEPIGPFSAGQGTYDSTVQPASGPFFRLLEVDSAGVETIVATEGRASVHAPVFPPASPSLGALEAEIDSLFPLVSSQPAASSLGEVLVVYTPTSALGGSALSYYVAFWQSWGYTVVVEDLDQYPRDPGDESVMRDAIDANIVTHANAGTKYFHLIGDASDAEHFAQPWQGTWATVKANYIARGDAANGQAALNIIPTWYATDWTTGQWSMTRWLPYYSTDLPYADIGTDGLPDVVVTRWPAATPYDVAALVDKLFWYYYSGRPGVVTSSVLLICDWVVAGNGRAEVTEHAARVAATLGPTSQLFASQYQDYVDRALAAAGLWVSRRPDLVLMSGTSSARNHLDMFFPKSRSGWTFSASMLWGWTPLVVAPVCGGGEFAMNEMYGDMTPLAQDLVLEPGSGAIALVGPSVASWLDGDLETSERFVEALMGNLGAPMAESWLSAVRSVLQDPGVGEHAKETARSFCFLGSPCATMHGSGGVALPAPEVLGGGTIQFYGAVPNPVRRGGDIVFAVPAREWVEIAVYDVAGRLVASLADEVFDPGVHAVRWSGRDRSGARMSPGIYFGRMEVGGRRLVRKIVVVE